MTKCEDKRGAGHCFQNSNKAENRETCSAAFCKGCQMNVGEAKITRLTDPGSATDSAVGAWHRGASPHPAH